MKPWVTLYSYNNLLFVKCLPFLVFFCSIKKTTSFRNFNTQTIPMVIQKIHMLKYLLKIIIQRNFHLKIRLIKIQQQRFLVIATLKLWKNIFMSQKRVKIKKLQKFFHLANILRNLNCLTEKVFLHINWWQLFCKKVDY